MKSKILAAVVAVFAVCVLCGSGLAVNSITYRFTTPSEAVIHILDDDSDEHETYLNRGQEFKIELVAGDTPSNFVWLIDYHILDSNNEGWFYISPHNGKTFSGVFDDSGNWNHTDVLHPVVEDSQVNIHITSLTDRVTVISGVLNAERIVIYAMTYNNDLENVPAQWGEKYIVIRSNGTAYNPSLSRGHIVPITSSDLAVGVLDNIADSAGVSTNEINFITQSDITEAPEPTQFMRDNVARENLEFAAKMQTVNFSSSGYYLLEVDFPDELVGTNINDLRLYFTSSTARNSVKSSQALTILADQILAGTELRNMLGDFVTTVPGKALVLVLANTGGSFSMYALKMILMLLAGGCSAELGATALFAVFAVFFMKR